MRAGRTLRLGLTLAAAAAASSALAHGGGSVGYASIAVDRGSARYRLTLWPAALPPAVAEQLRLARSGDATSRDELLRVIREKVTLVAEGRRCEAGPGFLPPAAPATESVTLVVDFACGDDLRDLLVRDDLFDAFGADYHTLGRIDAPGHTVQFAFTPESREARARPGRLVEAVIALSIALVAAENLARSPLVSRRWLVSFSFGLVHGFGFSSVLREIGLPTPGLLLALFGFNAGVELGQALAVAVALPALALLRTTRWEPRVIWSTSLAILLVGVVLFVERALL